MANVIVIGKGGREHAIAWKLAQSPEVNVVYVIPGNSAFDNNKIKSVDFNPLDFDKLIKFASLNYVDLIIVGPEVELAAGIVDALETKKFKVFGPNKYCAQIESSKDFAKQKMMQFGIPTAAYQTFDNAEEALSYLEKQTYPIVLKADGLAAGKGVTIPTSFEEAKTIILDIFENSRYGSSGSKVVIEQFLEGEEFSLLAFVSGTNIAYMQIAQDHKRALDGDKGENTGGMGAYTPVKHISPSQIKEGEIIIQKLAQGLVDEKTPFTGIIYAGLMATKDGVKTIEFNARFGDPETEVILPAMENDLYQVVNDIIDQKKVNLTWKKETFLGVVLASKGYPASYESGKHLDFSSLGKEELVFHMGTKLVDKQLVSNGGRVAFAVACANDISEAKIKVYRTIDKIKTDDFFFRKDIGHRAK